jgi:hypothetical protein
VSAFRPGPDPRRGLGARDPNRRAKPNSLPEYIREKTKRGKALVEWLVAIADGSARASRQVATKDGGVVDLEEAPTHRERLAAIRELWDRGLGTAIPQDKMPEPEQSESGGGESDGSIEPPKLGVA